MLLVGAGFGYLVARFWLVPLIRRVVGATAITWDDVLVRHKVFERLSHVVPALVISVGVRFVPELSDTTRVLIHRVALAFIVVSITAAVSGFLTALNDLYARNAEYRRRPIKGYLQLLKILLYVVAGVVVVSILLDRSPWLFISGLGALSAVTMLVFRDTILSLVASLQIASNDMIHVGDWIEMPQAGADGDVIDIALHVVKVQNWDKTISTIPTHKFISESFKNWRGMSESGGRRIKRAFNIDVNTVRFLDAEEIERFGRWSLLREYVGGKRGELEAYNSQPGRDRSIQADVRSLTNVGMLRAYVEAYLRTHPAVHHEGFTLIVRHLPPGSDGLPIEIYCFTNDTAWASYEAIQADIFDHIFAIVPEFGLRVFQQPAGSDLADLARPANAPPT